MIVLARHEAVGQGPTAWGVSAVHPGDAAGGAGGDLSDATDFGPHAAILAEQALTFIPAALVARLGIKVFMRLSDRQFAVAVSVLLMVSGFGLIV